MCPICTRTPWKPEEGGRVYPTRVADSCDVGTETGSSARAASVLKLSNLYTSQFSYLHNLVLLQSFCRRQNMWA